MLQVPGSAEAKKNNEKWWEGGSSNYVDTKHPKLTKDYYVVREGGGDQCKIVAGKFGDPPVIEDEKQGKKVKGEKQGKK